VSVSIKDNRAPSFSQSVYEATVVERLGIGEVVRSVSAADPDGDDVTYSILVGGSLLGHNLLSG